MVSEVRSIARGGLLESQLGPGQLAPPAFDEAGMRAAIESVVELVSYHDSWGMCHVIELRGFGNKVKRAEIRDYDLTRMSRLDVPNLIGDVRKALVNELVVDMRAEFEAAFSPAVDAPTFVEVLPEDD